MKSKWTLTLTLVLSVMATACTPVPAGSPPPEHTPFIVVTSETTIKPAITKRPRTAQVSTGSPGAPGSGATLMVTTPTLVARPDMKVIVNNEGTSPFLADKEGRSLYVYIKDSKNSSTSACVDDCTVDWPPLIVSTTPAAGAGVDASLLGTLSRENGSTQATYNGWPLYYYNMDTIPGTTNGPTVNGLWFLLSPSGEPLPH
jgi:predicted lipoprotein with Yx(FWY)xxD motif